MSDATSNRWLAEAGGRAGTYDDRWEQLAAQGHDVHGEADLVSWLRPTTVLDAGCGTGRVALELARRGVDVVGVDLDAAMLDRARAKGPELHWMQGDLAEVDVGRPFDVVVVAGNVMVYLAPGTEGRVVANMARHLAPGGALVAGFQLDEGRLDLATYDGRCAAAGLLLEHRWATWDRQPWVDGGAYAVSVHRLNTAGEERPPARLPPSVESSQEAPLGRVRRATTYKGARSGGRPCGIELGLLRCLELQGDAGHRLVHRVDATGDRARPAPQGCPTGL